MDLLVRFLFVQFLFAILKVQGSNGGGRLYFGFTSYNNVNNLRSDGSCCGGGGEGEEGPCSLPCHLIFQVSVGGLDGSGSHTEKTPSEVPLLTSGHSHLLFPSQDDQVINPLVFAFDHWPDCVDIEVNIFDVITPKGDNGEGETEGRREREDGQMHLVDKMVLHMASSPPSSFFAQRVLIGGREKQPSNLTVVVRYECDQTSPTTTCPSTSTSGVTSDANVIMDCPATTSAVTSTVTQSTGTTTPTASTSLWPETSLLMTSYGTEMTSNVAETTSQLSTLPEMPSSTVKNDLIVTSTSETDVVETSSSLSSSTLHVHPTSTKVPSPTPSTFKPTSSVIDVTPVPPVRSSEGKSVTDYWPEILGSVFGALVIIAIVGFLLYRRRRKALLSHQEIYTVTPRMVTTLEENGTAGRSDIPVQMAES